MTLSTAGKVGFYNRANADNDRGALGDVVFQTDLSGIGTLQAANVTFNGGSLSPGLSAGTLSIDGNLVLSSTTQLNFELTTPNVVGGGVNDLIAVNGNLTLAGKINLVDTPVDGTYTIFTYTGSLTTGLIELPQYTTLDFSNSGVVLLNYSAPIPEPGSWLLLAGLLPLARSFRKRRGERNA